MSRTTVCQRNFDFADFSNKISDKIDDLRTKAYRHSNDVKIADIYIHHSNQLELALRLIDHYLETGEVKIPD